MEVKATTFNSSNRSPLVSLIVPAFNLASYIERCVQTALAQSYRNVEVIVVDDCSTDATRELVAKLVETDSRLRLLSLTVNGGLHVARQEGMRIAGGSYIGFIDGDDWIHPQMIESMVSEALTEQADIVLCGATIATGMETYLGPKVRFRARRVYTDDILGRFCRLEFGSGVIWNKLFRREIIEPNLMRPFERRVDSNADYLVGFGCFGAASKVVVLPSTFCFYFYREDSMSRATKHGANFALTLRAYVVCLETYVSSNQNAARLIAQLYSVHFRMPVNQIKSPAEVEPHRDDIGGSLHRLASVYPAGIHDLIHVFDPHVGPGRPRLRSSVNRLRSAGKDVLMALKSRIVGNRPSY